MHPARKALAGLLALCASLSGSVRPSLAQPPPARAAIRPEVAALLKTSTATYHKMHSYRHTAVFALEGKNPANGETLKQESRFTLALDRPNRFAYRNESQPTGSAVCDGKTFINYRGGESPQFTQQAAPASFKGINIVDDVTFEPLATYIVALMLQGDALADKDVRHAMERASLKPGIMTENGKRWQVLTFPFGTGQQEMTDLYIGVEDHLIGKAVQRLGQFDLRVTETIGSVTSNGPIDPAIFRFTPPANAKRVPKFVPVQKPDDARNTVRERSRWAASGRGGHAPVSFASRS